MEVINSTDIIGEEIKEEARKKANIILKNADAEVEKLKAKTQDRIAKVKIEQANVYVSKLEGYKNDVFVRLPLQKFKERISYIEALMSSSSKKYFDSLDINSRLFIIKNILKRYKEVLQGKEIVVKFSGFDAGKVERLVSSVFSDCSIKEMKEVTNEEARRLSLYEGILVEDIGQTLICKASIESAKDMLFDVMKDKLCDVLIGGF